MSSDSERRAFNNDGMDPDWKPKTEHATGSYEESIEKMIRVASIVNSSKLADQEQTARYNYEKGIRFALELREREEFIRAKAIREVCEWLEDELPNYIKDSIIDDLKSNFGVRE